MVGSAESTGPACSAEQARRQASAALAGRDMATSDLCRQDDAVRSVVLRPDWRQLLAGRDVVDRLGDVGRVVADPLDVLGAEQRCVHAVMLRGSSIM